MSRQLAKLEKRIEDNKNAAWYENNLILLKIRNESLYKKKHKTFEEYLRERWGYKETHGYQLMKSAELMLLMTTQNLRKKDVFAEVQAPTLPKNEGQCRPLINKLSNNGERLKVWAEVVATGEKINAELVQSKVDEFLASGEEVPDIEYEEDTEIIIGKAAKKQDKIKQRQEEIENALKAEIKNAPLVYCKDVNEFLNQFEDSSVDLLITDPPYSTDVDDINKFAESWLNNALKKVKDSGYAFVFIGAYPEEINAYLNIAMPTQILVWEYKNTLGQNPKDRYKLNYQAILFYRMSKAGSLNIDITNEQWAVQSINAPDGRLGDRYHAWQKPIELADRLIRHTTNTGEKVIDPFCCTGTFLLAASKLNRNALGSDISDDNLKIAVQRGCQYA